MHLNQSHYVDWNHKVKGIGGEYYIADQSFEGRGTFILLLK